MVLVALAVALAQTPDLSVDPLGEEVPPLGTGSALVDGPGLTLGVGAGSPDLLTPLPEVPVAPRLALGAYGEPVDAVLVGGRLGGVVLLPDTGATWAGEAAVAVAVGSRERTVWAGFETGVAMTPGAPGVDAPDLNVLGAGLFAVDVDPLTTVGVRVGLSAGARQVEARHGLTLTYRPAPRSGVTLGVHGGVREGQHGLTGQLELHQRIGPIRERWAPPVVVDEPEPAVEVHEHPELACAPGDLPTGRPPPLGLEGWCVRVERNGNPVRNGPYVRWHDSRSVAERGAYLDGRESGEWLRFDHAGNVRERGGYVGGREEGPYALYADDGSVREEGAYRAGERHGRWRFYDEEGRLDQEGRYSDGARVGEWLDYDDQSRVMRRRSYDSGRLVRDEQVVYEELEEEP